MSTEYVFPEDTTDTPFKTYWSNPEWERNSATHKLDATYYLLWVYAKKTGLKTGYPPCICMIEPMSAEAALCISVNRF
jgi:hypothetical protein